MALTVGYLALLANLRKDLQSEIEMLGALHMPCHNPNPFVRLWADLLSNVLRGMHSTHHHKTPLFLVFALL